MLTITIPGGEFFNDLTNEFYETKPTTLVLEHSLVSISKWESKYHKPFINEGEKTFEETIYYIKCMTITQNVKDSVYDSITNEIMKTVNDYIDNPMSATWFNDLNDNKKRSTEKITSELIYYWMIALNIDKSCEKWHLNRLLNLVRICNIKNKNDNKMSKRQTMTNNTAINNARKQQLKTSG